MYEFIRIQYRMGRITKEQVRELAGKGHITALQAEDIINGV